MKNTDKLEGELNFGDNDMQIKVGIKAIEYDLPIATLSNEELAVLYSGWTADRIYNKTGIRSRHFASEMNVFRIWHSVPRENSSAHIK